MSMPQSDDRIDVEVDDEHPFFTEVWEQAKAARTIDPDKPGAAVPESLTAELRIGGVVQTYHLEHVVDVSWSKARARMLTRWRPDGAPTRITQPTGDTTK
jgi:hypothetical protein